MQMFLWSREKSLERVANQRDVAILWAYKET